MFICFIKSKIGLNKPIEKPVNKITQYLCFSLKIAQSKQENTHMKECLSLSNPTLNDLMFLLPFYIVVGNLYLKIKTERGGERKREREREELICLSDRHMIFGG